MESILVKVWDMLTMRGFSHVQEVSRIAMREASSDRDDKAARAVLAEACHDRLRTIPRAMKIFAATRDEYLNDRAYRLLAAVADNRFVEPIAPSNAQRFSQEMRLGQMPLAEAFAQLAVGEPRIAKLALVGPGADRMSSFPLAAILGPIGDTDEELGRSRLALSVAHQYLAVRRGEIDVDESVPYFAAPVKVASRSGARPV